MNTKKTLVTILSLALVAILLTACSGGKASIEGKWSAPDLAEQMGMGEMGALAGDVVYEFTKDGKLLLTMGGKNLEEVAREQMKAAGIPDAQVEESLKDTPQVTYKVDGNKLTMTTKIGEVVTDDSTEFTISGDKLTLASGIGDAGEGITLTRVK